MNEQKDYNKMFGGENPEKTSQEEINELKEAYEKHQEALSEHLEENDMSESSKDILENGGLYKVIEPLVNVRREPSASSEIVRTIASTDDPFVIVFKDETDYGRLDTEDEQWINLNFVEKV